MLYAILFVGTFGASPATMEPVVALGPVATLAECAAVGALAIDNLNRLHPLKDFRIDCAPTDEIKRRPNAVLYDLAELAALAGVF